MTNQFNASAVITQSNKQFGTKMGESQSRPGYSGAKCLTTTAENIIQEQEIFETRWLG
jgi:hypothetical protein